MKKFTAFILQAILVVSLMVGMLSVSASAANTYNAAGSIINDVSSPLRNDAGFYLGITFYTGHNHLKVTELGRYVQEGSTGTHTVAIFEPSDMSVVCSANVNTSGVAAGQIAYAAVDKQATLLPDHTYYLLSLETADGDKWFEGSALYASARPYDVTFLNWCYYFNDGKPATCGNDNASRGFVGVDLKYTYADPETKNSNPSAFGNMTPTENLRNDCGFALGGYFTVGSTDVKITDLGRMCYQNNNQPHTIYIAEKETGTVVASATVDMNGKTAGQFVYASLSSPVTLTAGKSYFIMSYENYGGDKFAELGQAAYASQSDKVTLGGWAYKLPDGGGDSGEGGMAVGLDMLYSKPSNPDTSDTLSIALAVLAVAAAGVTVAVKKKH